ALAPERAAIRAAALELGRIQAEVHDRSPDASAAIDRWLAGSPALQARLEAKAPLSLFDPGRLKRLSPEGAPRAKTS
ncbi:MAG: hypothetical protein JOZ27_05695, partial [Caulobacteraceae bacterium]|nr:hypothetical protein [Caulobacteraceae bacterium]